MAYPANTTVITGAVVYICSFHCHMTRISEGMSNLHANEFDHKTLGLEPT